MAGVSLFVPKGQGSCGVIERTLSDKIMSLSGCHVLICCRGG